jgi:hypothetical protein
MWIQVHPWSVNQQEIRAANPVDFLIREDHRGLPTFLSLFRGTMKESHGRADLVFHTSNPLTDDLYRRLLKFEPATELDGAIIPTRPFGAAKAANIVNLRILGTLLDRLFASIVRVLGAFAAMSPVRVKRGIDPLDQAQLVARLRNQESVCGARTPEMLAWRFRGAGPIRYQQFGIFRGGRAVGYVVTSDRDVEGTRGRFVVDIVWPDSPSRAATALVWLQLAAGAAAAGQHALFIFYNRANKSLRSIVRFPMVTVPRSRLPQRGPIFVRTTTGTDSLDSVDWNSGYYVLSDLDLF